MSVTISGTGTITGLTFGTWQNLLASRAAGTTYTNSTSSPIMVAVCITSTYTTGAATSTFTIDGIVVGNGTVTMYNGSAWVGLRSMFTFIVPAGSTYSCTASNNPSLVSWAELRP